MAKMGGADPQQVTAKLVAEAAKRGDEEAQKIIDEAMHYLGIGMANMVNLFNPQKIVIGGGLVKMGEELLVPVRQAIDRYAFPRPAQTVQVVKAELGEYVGVLGAAAVALGRVNGGNPP